MILLGISQGASVCIDYAVRHPERVSHLLLYGAYARGIARRDDPNAERIYSAIVELARLGWRTDNPAFRQVFTSRFIPDGTDQQVDWFNDLCRKTTTPEIAAELLRARSQIDVSELLPRVRTPTLVLHGREDNVTPIEEGRRLAAFIPGAQFVELDSKNHILLEGEPAWARFCEAVLDFVGLAASGEEDRAFATLSARERQILVLITDGLANAEIAERLSLSEKTVRNHVSNLFDKLGVWTRAQAIVFARDRGFRA
jgi:pimeloyl-ACP methyl ester carboxylesterase/DNA-binding CsgD family transcriptional regulator